MELIKRIWRDPPGWGQIIDLITAKPPASGVVIHSKGYILWMDRRAQSILEPPPEAETIYDIANIGDSFVGRTMERIEGHDTEIYIVPHRGRVTGSIKVLEMTPHEISVCGIRYRLVFVREMLQVELERKAALKTLIASMF